MHVILAWTYCKIFGRVCSLFLCFPRNMLDAFDALRIVLASGWGSVTGPVMFGPGLAHILR